MDSFRPCCAATPPRNAEAVVWHRPGLFVLISSISGCWFHSFADFNLAKIFRKQNPVLATSAHPYHDMVNISRVVESRRAIDVINETNQCSLSAEIPGGIESHPLPSTRDGLSCLRYHISNKPSSSSWLISCYTHHEMGSKWISESFLRLQIYDRSWALKKSVLLTFK